MVFEDSSTYYDVLDVRPDATPEELREAYVRAKTAYSKDSVALYTLVDGDELKRILGQIEEAYLVLSNPLKRKEYDARYGFIDPNEELVSHRSSPPPRKIISIDRVPPMESSRSADELLIPPSTDFGQSIEASAFPGSADEPDPLTSAPIIEDAPLRERRSQQSYPTQQSLRAPAPAPSYNPPYPSSAMSPAQPPAFNRATDPLPRFHTAAHAHLAIPDPRRAVVGSPIEQEIAAETEWRGPFLKKVRESMRLSLEEMASITKISKTYLTAIEDENFVKLPAPVYVRGFVMQIARILKLPTDAVVNAYLERYKQLKIR
jgi:hypothetical protein